MLWCLPPVSASACGPSPNTVPKPLVRLGGRALLDHVLDRLADAGIADAMVNVHYLPELIEAHLRGRTTPHITISDERDQLLDTGGAVNKALHLLGIGRFLRSQFRFGLDRKPGLDAGPHDRAWDPDEMDSLLLLAPVETSLGYCGRGDFSLGDDGEVAPPAKAMSAFRYVFAGVSINHPRPVC